MKNKKHKKQRKPVEKNPEGRPPMYNSPLELQNKISEYFKKGVSKRKVKVGKKWRSIPVPTITGLVLYCGFCDRHSFYAYEAKPEFSYTIKTARTFIERTYEELLQTGSCTGAIFALKNFGWVDKTEVEQSYKPLTKEQRDECVANLRLLGILK